MHPVSVDSCVPNLPRPGLRYGLTLPALLGPRKVGSQSVLRFYLVIDKGLGNEKGSRGNRPKSGTVVS